MLKVSTISLVILIAGWPGGPRLAAQTRYPYIDAVFPPVVERGKTTEVAIQATGSLKTAYRALIDGDGIRCEVAPHTAENKLADNRALVKLEVSADALPGPREIRLATAEAVTTAAVFQVILLPVGVESGKNANLAAAQEMALPSVVCGRIAASVEVDWFRFQGRAGDRVNFTVLGARLQETIHHIGRFIPHFDPYISLLDAQGRELAASDDYFFADPMLSFELPAAGTYHVAVREANFKGHEFYTYGLIGTLGPCAVLASPVVLPPGKISEVSLAGPGWAAGNSARAAMPGGAPIGLRCLVQPEAAGVQPADLLWAVAGDLPAAAEVERSGEDANGRIESAQAIAVPSCISGRLGRPDDADIYAFEAVQGARYRLEVTARQVYSPLDAELSILNAQGAAILTQDDARDPAGRASKDPAVEWTAPAAGKFFVKLRDVHNRGGAEFIYCLQCSLAEPDFELTLDPDLSMVGPGNRAPVYVRAARRGGFNDAIQLDVEGLPPGVRALTAPIQAGATDACIIFEAAPDAPAGASLYRIAGKAAAPRSGGAAVELIRRAIPLAEVYQARRVIARTSAIAVTRPSDIQVNTEVLEIALKPGESKQIPIRLVRSEFYPAGSVTLWAMLRFEGSIFGNSLPPGVSVDERNSRTSLNGSEVEGVLALKAAPDAKPSPRTQTAVIGLVPIEFSVFVPHCTAPLFVSVSAPDPAPAAAAAKP